MVTFDFKTSKVIVIPQHTYVLAVFPDTTINEFKGSYLEGSKEYHRIAQWAGYGEDWKRYGLEHELTHHWLADWKGWPHSWTIYENPPFGSWPQHVADEEHVVNGLQRYAYTNILDDYNILTKTFGQELNTCVDELRTLWARLQ